MDLEGGCACVAVRYRLLVAHSLQPSLRATAKQSRAAEGSIGRDCFGAQGAPRNDIGRFGRNLR
jgi:hypothetical protein